MSLPSLRRTALLLVTTLVAALPATAQAGTTFDVPPTIDASGTTEVSTQLMHWLATVPAGAAGDPNTIRFAPGGTYWSDYTLLLRNQGSGSIGGVMWSDNRNPSNPINIPDFALNHVRIDLNGATIIQRTIVPYKSGATVLDPRKRWGDPILSTQGATDVEIFGGTIQGSHPTGGYDAPREEWTGVRLIGNPITDDVSHLYVHDMTIRNVWGDFVYIASNTSAGSMLTDVRVENNTLSKAGRQGIVLNGGTGVSIRNNVITKVSHLTFDSEPTAAQGFSHVWIDSNSGTAGNLGYFQFSGGSASTADHLHITNNRLSSGHFKITLVNGATSPARPVFEFRNNVGLDLTAPFGNLYNKKLIAIGHWDGVTIDDNSEYFTLPANGIPRYYGVQLNGTTGVEILRNCWINAVDTQC